MIVSAARARTDADAVLLTMSDLHARYAGLPALLQAIRDVKAEFIAPVAMLLNGDVFERGNIVCLRSGAKVDWAFLSAIAGQMPVVVNPGSHEIAILDDMATFVETAASAGVEFISNLTETRSNQLYASASTSLTLGGVNVSLLGLGPTNPFLSRKPLRETLGFQDTGQYVKDAFADTTADSDWVVIMSHAGVAADKAS